MLLARLNFLVFAVSTSLSFYASLSKAQEEAYPGVVSVIVDATDVLHRVFKVTQQFPVKPGPMKLWLPKWEPGTHSPTVNSAAFAGLMIFAGNERLEFKRDTIDMHAFHIVVPDGVSQVRTEHEILTPVDGSGRVVMTPTMFNLQWIAALLYPAGYNASQIQYKASLIAPKGWQVFTALEVESKSGDKINYKQIDFANLLDSPVFAGKHSKVVDLAPGAKLPVRLNIVADDPRFLEIKPEHLATHKNLVTQAIKLFRSQHYTHYDFLLALSKQLGGIGLEHHRSSENAVDTPYFLDWDPKKNGNGLLPHEYVHSWNGKFRRPADLTTPNYNTPMQDTLLWVYEGQTTYWGQVLTARSGIRNQQGALDDLANDVATYAENRPGFSWRTLQDTTNDPIIAYRAGRHYPSWQLALDYYRGAQLMWLEADVKIRSLSNNQKSLDDFAAAFFGVDDGAWAVKTYTFDDVVKTLNDVVAYDWRSFLRTRLDGHGSLIGGIEAAGYKLVFKETPNETLKAAMSSAKISGSHIYSLGFLLDNDGKFSEVRWDSPAFKAGAAMGMTVIAVNDRHYNKDYLDDAVRNAQKTKSPIKLLVKHFDEYKTLTIDYHGGLRYPYLERIPNTTDYLIPILTAK